MAYSFVFEGGLNNSYVFDTGLGVVYDIQFRPSPYILGNEQAVYANDIYEFIIEVLYNPLEKSPPLDKLVAPTIAAIFKDFYHRKSETICIYICDSTDRRQDIRRRKFEQWFFEYQDLSYLKIDDRFIDKNKNIYPISMILKKTHPHYAQITVDFAAIIIKYNFGK
jgi:hypothetical protein